MNIYKRLALGAALLGIVVAIIAQIADFAPAVTYLLELSLLAAALPYGLETELRHIQKQNTINPAKHAAKFAVDHILIGKKHYGSAELDVAPNTRLCKKVLKMLMDSNLKNIEMYQSTMRMHGGQHIVYIYGPAAEVIANADGLWDHDHIRKLTASDRKYFNSKALQSVAGLSVAALAYRLHGEAKSTLLGIVQISDSAQQSRLEYRKQQKQILRHGLARATRINLATSAALLCLIVTSALTLGLFHVAPAITVTQVLSLSGLLILPTAALAYDDHRHALSKARPNTPLLFGAVTATVAYGNYLFYFFRHSLNPAYLETSLPQYQQATTIVLATILLCSFAYILLERADSYERFFDYHLSGNNRLLAGFGVSLLVLALIIYAPPLQWLFTTQPLDLNDWSSVILATGLYVLVRLLQRHTRKHTRHSVLALHREIHG